MELSLEERINRLLNQMEDRNLAAYQVEAIQEKIKFLQSLQEQE